MGDLHAGHLALIRRSLRENRATIVSIFVNPRQFDRKKDYKLYHRDLPRDLRLLRREGVDAAFVPGERDMVPEGYRTRVEVEGLSRGLCGKFRPGHFAGVAAVVLKLLNLARPDRAYFGMKDYQQFRIVERMVRDLDLGVEIVPCPTERDRDGLALSSRNRRLSPEERSRAAGIFPALQSVAHLIKSEKHTGTRGARLSSIFRAELRPGKEDRIEYVELVHPETLAPVTTARPPALLAAAVWVGRTRLIDNLMILS